MVLIWDMFVIRRLNWTYGAQEIKKLVRVANKSACKNHTTIRWKFCVGQSKISLQKKDKVRWYGVLLVSEVICMIRRLSPIHFFNVAYFTEWYLPETFDEQLGGEYISDANTTATFIIPFL